MWLYPYLSWLVDVAVIAVIVSMVTIPDLRSQLWFTLISTALFPGIYLLRRRSRATGGPRPDEQRLDEPSPTPPESGP